MLFSFRQHVGWTMHIANHKLIFLLVLVALQLQNILLQTYTDLHKWTPYMMEFSVFGGEPTH